MRRLLLILMIAVLPVRGWASDVMTVASAAQQLSSTTATIEFIATHALQTGARATFYGYFEAKPPSSMPWDCPWRASSIKSANNADNVMQDGVDTASDIVSDPASDSPSNRFCKGCNTCQLCMALVTGYPMALFSATYLPQAVQHVTAIGFTSAERAPGFKPPIS